MSTHNMCIRGEIRKIICGYPLLSVAMYGAGPKYSVNLSPYHTSRVERKTMVTQTYFLKPLFRGNLDPFVNNANLGAIAHTSNGT